MSERLARLVWWWIMKFLRRAPVKNVNHKIARYLGPKQAAEFLRRGQQQNAFARRHAVGIIRFSINLIAFSLLCTVLYFACQWLLEHGYFNAPGTRRPVTPNE